MPLIPRSDIPFITSSDMILTNWTECTNTILKGRSTKTGESGNASSRFTAAATSTKAIIKHSLAPPPGQLLISAAGLVGGRAVWLHVRLCKYTDTDFIHKNLRNPYKNKQFHWSFFFPWTISNMWIKAISNSSYRREILRFKFYFPRRFLLLLLIA